VCSGWEVEFEHLPLERRKNEGQEQIGVTGWSVRETEAASLPIQVADSLLRSTVDNTRSKGCVNQEFQKPEFCRTEPPVSFSFSFFFRSFLGFDGTTGGQQV
jgi:hypothetical protein